MHSCGNNPNDFKKGFNNKFVSFQHPFNWKYLENENEFIIARLFDQKYQSIITISIAPCLTNDIKDLKETIESDFKEKQWKIKDSKVIKEEDIQAWDVIFEIKEEEKLLELEQYNILRENNLYTIEIASHNRTQIMNDYVNLIRSFKIHKPSYDVNENSYKKIEE